MTLKEKFLDIIENTKPYWCKVVAASCEDVADEYAISFAEWIFNLTIREWENETTDDLLRYYKKEKGL